MSVLPGWYPDPAEPSTQRYWDGEGWIGDPLPVEAIPPPGPPRVAPVTTPASAATMPAGSTPATPGSASPSAADRGPAGSAAPTSAAPTSAAPTSAAPGSAGPGSAGAVDQRAPGAGARPESQPYQAPSGPTTSTEPAPPAPTPPPGWPAGFPYPLTAEGPAPQPHGMRLASPGTRFMARLVDILILGALSVVANGYFAYQWWVKMEPTIRAMADQGVFLNPNAEGVPSPPGSATTLEFTILLVTMALWFAYEVPAIANRGQTLGKRLFAVKVVRIENTEPIGFRRAWRRWNPLGLPTLFWPCCGIGFLMQLVDCLFVAIDRPLRQAIHDKSAGTVVVDVHRSPRPAPPNGDPR